MRLIDRLRDGEYVGWKKESKRFQRNIQLVNKSNLPIIDISNIADYMISNAASFDGLMIRDIFSCALPPFSECWMECDVNTYPWLDKSWKQVGILTRSFDFRARSLEDKHRQGGRFRQSDFEQIAWIIRGDISLLIESRASLVALALAGSSQICLNEQGIMLGSALGRLHLGSELIKEASAEPLTESMINAMCLVGMAASFMSCKNVQLIENQAPRHERRQREREKKPPLTKYYTLEIEPMKKILRTEGKSEDVGLKKALHICRGHFAYYTPDKPLFGKVSGRFWIPAHVRGSKEAGEIKKDYKIKNPSGFLT